MAVEEEEVIVLQLLVRQINRLKSFEEFSLPAVATLTMNKQVVSSNNNKKKKQKNEKLEKKKKKDLKQ